MENQLKYELKHANIDSMNKIYQYSRLGYFKFQNVVRYKISRKYQQTAFINIQGIYVLSVIINILVRVYNTGLLK